MQGSSEYRVDEREGSTCPSGQANDLVSMRGLLEQGSSEYQVDEREGSTSFSGQANDLVSIRGLLEQGVRSDESVRRLNIHQARPMTWCPSEAC